MVDVIKIEACFAGRRKKDKTKEKELLDQKYELRRKGFTLVLDCQIGKEHGPDKIQGCRLKSLTAVHEVLATVLNECIEVGDVP